MMDAKKKKTRTQIVRHAIGQLIEDDFTIEDIRRLIATIEREDGAKAAFSCYMQLADFVLPKLQRIEHTGKNGDKLTLEHVLKSIESAPHYERLPEPNSDIIDIKKEQTPDNVEYGDTILITR
jgi:hypothetical protein